MTTNAMINEMFEEIKESLDSLKEIVKSQEKVSETAKFEREKRGQQSRLTIEKILQQIGEHLEAISSTSNFLRSEIQDSENKIISAINNHRKEQSHQRKLKFKRKTIVWTLGVLFSLAAGSITGNVYQFKSVKRMKENDLKYRFIKVSQGISKEQLDQLESVFHADDVENKIDSIRKAIHPQKND